MSFVTPTPKLRKPDYTALINEALKRYEGQVKVVSVTIFKHPCRNKHIGAISFDSSLRNLTSCGPRDYNNPDQLINAIEEYDDIRLKNYDWKNEPKMEIRKKNSVLHCLHLTRELYKALPTTPFRYTIYIRGYKHILKQLVTSCLVGPYEKVTICGRLYGDQILNYDEMDFLLNLIKPEAYFELSSEMIDDFRHEKAFQFKSFFYHHAEWVTLEDLKSLRNHNVVRLGSTKFTSKDINKFLKYYTECDEPMMNSFSVHLGDPCVPQVILHRLKYFGLAKQNYLISAPLVYYM